MVMPCGLSGWEIEAAYWQPSILEIDLPWEYCASNLARHLALPESCECNLDFQAAPDEFDFTLHPEAEC